MEVVLEETLLMKVGEETTEVSSISLATVESLAMTVDVLSQDVQLATVESLAVMLDAVEEDVEMVTVDFNLKFTKVRYYKRIKTL